MGMREADFAPEYTLARGSIFGAHFIVWLAPITRPRKGKNKVHPDGCGRL